MTRPSPCISALLVLLLCPLGALPVSAQEYIAGAGLGFSYSDQDVTPAPPAQVAGDTSPGSQWIRYDVTAGPGQVLTWHQLYSCCVNNAHGTGSFRVDDLVFASPGGTGGTADVTVNFSASATSSHEGSNLRVDMGLPSGTVQVGTWIAGPTGSTGVFAGENGMSLSGTFTSPVFTVPLDVPVSFTFQAAGGTGSYQIVSTLDGAAGLPSPGSGTPVFNVVSGPDGISVHSEQANIVDNEWMGFADPVAVLELDEASAGVRLDRPAPNPARGPVTLALDLPRRAGVRVTVHDVAGRTIDVVRDGDLESGRHRLTWRPGPAVAAGVYFVRLEALGQERVRRVTLLR